MPPPYPSTRIRQTCPGKSPATQVSPITVSRRESYLGAEQQFIAQHGEGRFEHAAELLELLRNGTATASPNTPAAVQSDELLSTYRARRQHLKGLRGAHAQQLHSEVSRLCEVLEQHSDTVVRLWIFSAPPNIEFVVFVPDAKSEAVVCCRSYDKRRTAPETWEKIWA